MPRYEITSPSGQKFEITAPDGASEQEVMEYAQKQFSGMEAQPRPQLSPRDQAAEAKVREYRKANPVSTYVDDTVRQLARGVPVAGAYVDEASAWLNSRLPAMDLPLVGKIGGTTYEEAKAIEDAKDRVGDEESSKLFSLPYLGDVTGSGLTQLAGGVMSAPVTPVLRAMGGNGLLSNMVNYGVTGGVLGAAHGSGMGNTAEERLYNAGVGGALGTGLGAAAPVVARGVGNASNYIMDRRQPLPPGVGQFDRRAVANVADAADADQIFTPGSRNFAPARAATLGREGMLADYGPNLRAEAGAIAQKPGEGMTVIRDALTARREAAPTRIRSDMNQNFGMPANIPQTLEATRQNARQMAGPLYQQFYASLINPTERLNGYLRRAASTGAVRRAQQIMEAEGIDPRILTRYLDDPMTAMTGQQRRIQQRVPHGLELDYIKRGIDDLANSAEPRSNLQRIYRELARNLRTEVDRIISPQNPQQSVWAQARAIWEEGTDLENSVTAGRGAYARNLSADQLQADMQGLNHVEELGYRLGAREAQRAQMDTAATTMGEAGDNAARKMNNSLENQRKNTLLYGAPASQNMSRRITAENRMAQTDSEVMANSATAIRLQAQKKYPGPVQQDTANTVGQKSGVGFIAEGVVRVGNILRAGAINEARQRRALDAARMLVAQGADRNQIVNGLRVYAQRRRLSRQANAAIENLITTIAEGGRQPLIDGYATGQ